MPVILIHGTTSSAVTWANRVNDLLEVPAIRDHFEFWFFSYASGNPIPYSAYQLREAIHAAVTQSGGVLSDPALGQITLIGHSQGGLLAKMLVIDPGYRFSSGMGLPPLDSLSISAKSKALAKAALLPTPVPEVRRVVFISTPQHGSFIAGFSITKMVGKLVSLPLDVTRAGAEVFGGNGRYVLSASASCGSAASTACRPTARSFVPSPPFPSSPACMRIRSSRSARAALWRSAMTAWSPMPAPMSRMSIPNWSSVPPIHRRTTPPLSPKSKYSPAAARLIPRTGFGARWTGPAIQHEVARSRPDCSLFKRVVFHAHLLDRSVELERGLVVIVERHG